MTVAIDSAFDRAVNAAELLVVSDFDGTLAPLTGDAMRVHPDPVGVAALQQLSELPHTTVAVLSGRDLQSLAKVAPLREPVVLAGSHGAETAGAQETANEQQQRLLHSAADALEAIAEQASGAFVEYKPYHLALHVRLVADQEHASRMLEEAASIAANIDGLSATFGKCIVEIAATTCTKGTWIQSQQQATGATVTIFAGDDVTDEHGFAALQPTDISIKVGSGATGARYRLADTAAISQWFARLAAARAARYSAN
ncbi:trehalose-phosphatase [Corynebacterium choanae]|uniref:trehalose-phosphatase n=1 Tax=Corynebacterium choanae TaxID=1862358 RepID=UPI0013DE66FA|nr:trehalose-phosphatase [Corynebacterium choanae]